MTEHWSAEVCVSVEERRRTCAYLILRVQIHLSSALHRAEEVTEALVDLIHQQLQRIQPALFRLGNTSACLVTLPVCMMRMCVWGGTHLSDVASVSGQSVGLVVQLLLHVLDLLLAPVIFLHHLRVKTSSASNRNELLFIFIRIDYMEVFMLLTPARKWFAMEEYIQNEILGNETHRRGLIEVCICSLHETTAQISEDLTAGFVKVCKVHGIK